MYNLYVHVGLKTVICRWDKPLCGWQTNLWKGGRFSHPEAKIYIAYSTGAKFDYHRIVHPIMVALQDEGLRVNALIDQMPIRKSRQQKISNGQLRLF